MDHISFGGSISLSVIYDGLKSSELVFLLQGILSKIIRYCLGSYPCPMKCYIILLVILGGLVFCGGCTSPDDSQESSSIAPLLSTSPQPTTTAIQTAIPTTTKTTLPTTPTTRPTTKVTTATPRPTTISTVGPICDCSGDRYNCADFPLPNGATAYSCFDYCKSIGKGDIHRLDRDGDGRMCE